MTRSVFEHQRGYLRRERGHAVPEDFIAARPLVGHYEFAAMFAAFADLVTLHDLDGRIRLASDSSRAILGLAPNEIIGRMPADAFVCSEDAPVFAAAIDRLRNGEDAVEVLFRVQARTSQTRWLETRIGAVRGLNGSSTAFVAVSRLVTDRLEAARRQQEDLERYRQVTYAVPGMTAEQYLTSGRDNHSVDLGGEFICTYRNTLPLRYPVEVKAERAPGPQQGAGC